MKSIHVSRFVLGFVFSVLFAVGVQAMTPVVYATCAQNSNQGGCKKTSTEPEPTVPADPDSFEGFVIRFDIVLEVMGVMF
jgi:hypothetical protein